MSFAKLKTLDKIENKSDWQIKQPKFDQIKYKYNGDNPWKDYNSYMMDKFPQYKYYQSAIGLRTTKKEMNKIIDTEKSNLMTKYFHNNY